MNSLIYRQIKPLTEGKTRGNVKEPPKTAKRPIKPPPQRPVPKQTTRWSWDWPQKEGHYWAYGMLYKEVKGAELYMFKVYANSDGSFSYACNGGYFFKGLTGVLMWAKMETPTMVPMPEIMYRILHPHMFEDGK